MEIDGVSYDVVALRKESVDRNEHCGAPGQRGCPSLSARRAWIEMMKCQAKKYSGLVALRKESVDRNETPTPTFADWGKSPSARRAWIEMLKSAEDEAPEVSLSARRV